MEKQAPLSDSFIHKKVMEMAFAYELKHLTQLYRDICDCLIAYICGIVQSNHKVLGTICQVLVVEAIKLAASVCYSEIALHVYEKNGSQYYSRCSSFGSYCHNNTMLLLPQLVHFSKHLKVFGILRDTSLEGHEQCLLFFIEEQGF